MPDVDGLRLARQLTRIRPGMRVPCMSGYTREGIPGGDEGDPEREHLQQPITPERLLRKVRKVLDRPEGRAGRPKGGA